MRKMAQDCNAKRADLTWSVAIGNHPMRSLHFYPEMQEIRCTPSFDIQNEVSREV